MLAVLKDLLANHPRRLFLKTGAVVSDLSDILPEGIPDLEVRAYPAIEALSFAVCELKDHNGLPAREEAGYYRDSPMGPRASSDGVLKWLSVVVSL